MRPPLSEWEKQEIRERAERAVSRDGRVCHVAEREVLALLDEIESLKTKVSGLVPLAEALRVIEANRLDVEHDDNVWFVDVWWPCCAGGCDSTESNLVQATGRSLLSAVQAWIAAAEASGVEVKRG